MEAEHDRADLAPGALARMTREEWLAFHVARAPKITPEQWRKTRMVLRDQDESAQR